MMKDTVTINDGIRKSAWSHKKKSKGEFIYLTRRLRGRKDKHGINFFKQCKFLFENELNQVDIYTKWQIKKIYDVKTTT